MNKQFHEVNLHARLLQDELPSRVISHKLPQVMRRDRERQGVLPRPDDLADLPQDLPVLVLKVAHVLLPELLREVHRGPQQDPRRDLGAVHVPRAHLEDLGPEPVGDHGKVVLDLGVAPLGLPEGVDQPVELAGHHLPAGVRGDEEVAEGSQRHAAHLLLLDGAEDAHERGDEGGGGGAGGGILVVEGEPGGADHFVEKLEHGGLDVSGDDAVETLETRVGGSGEEGAVAGVEKKLVKRGGRGADVKDGGAVELAGDPLDVLLLLSVFDVALLVAI